MQIVVLYYARDMGPSSFLLTMIIICSVYKCSHIIKEDFRLVSCHDSCIIFVIYYDC